MKISQDKLKQGKGQLILFFRFVRFILPYRAKWIMILILSGIGALLGLVNPYLTKLVIDKAIGNKDLKLFMVLAVIGGTIFVITGVLNGVKQYLERYIKARVRFDLNKKVFTRISGFPFSWFQNKSTGESVYKISYDISRVEDLITTVPPQAAAVFPKLIVILFIIFRLNWQMAVFSLCLAPFLYLPPYYFINKRRAIWERLIKNSEQIFKTLHEVFSHIYLIKIFGKETFEIRKYLKKLISNIRIELSGTRLEIFSGFSASVLDKIIIGFISIYGGYQVIKGKMTLGSLTAIMVYLSQLVGMQGTFINFFQTTVLGLVSCQRVADMLDETEKAKEKAVKSVIFKKGDILFKKVSFGYLSEMPVLKGLDFSIKENANICLAAASGTGKTTLLNLIIGLYSPWEGEIFIDTNRISDIKSECLKSQIGMALQEPFLFNDTVKNNILYGREDAGEVEMIKAAGLSLVNDFVKNMPNRYETIIGENACKLSEGQKQKIAIARALIKRPKILILDEAMSSMDTVSEEKILSNIRRDLKGTTVIMVSHRLSTVMNADMVYFLKSRSEIAIASGESLLQNDKDFYDLFKEQLIRPTTKIQPLG